MKKKKNYKRIKSRPKAAGHKTNYLIEHKLYSASFGRGNEAVLQQKLDATDDYTVTNIESEPILLINHADDKHISFSSEHSFVSDNKFDIPNPLRSANIGQDELGLKPELEKRYFGKTFNDNIHIQIIHCIQDIEKTISVSAAIISAALNHLVDGDEKDYLDSDFIGYMNTLNTYEVFMDPSKNPALSQDAVDNINTSRKKFEKLLASKRLGYFGFVYDPEDTDNAENVKKRLYHLVAFAGQLRQWSFHSKGENDKTVPISWLYKFENLDKEYLDTLDYFFDSRFNEINDNFVTKNATNLCILKEIFPNEDFKGIADLYYDFIVVKSHKNIGFSIRKLREKMLEQSEAAPIIAQDMDQYRSKLYKLMDFCIFKHYHNLPELSEKNVDALRSAFSEEEKENIYNKEAERLWKIFKKTFLTFCEKINTWVTDKNEEKVIEYIDKDAYRKNSSVSYFSKLMYAMCFFLDGKEINDLLTTLINKFDNIASFVKTAKDLNVNVDFKDDYAFFNDIDKGSKKYVSELNIVKNISLMKKPPTDNEKALFLDALKILGLPINVQLNKEIEMLIEDNNSDDDKPKKSTNPFLNFIKNNVIKQNRFIYVIRFCNPENVRKLVNNTIVTEFVLGRMPQEQIERYYSSCIETELNLPVQKKITSLAKMMSEINFERFSKVNKKSSDPKENIEIERSKAIIRLYLTVVYLLVKNLVNVNSRYIMAFHSLERDAQLYNIKKIDSNYLRLTEQLCKEGDEYGKNLSNALLEEKKNGKKSAENWKAAMGKIDVPKNRFLAQNRRLRECVEQDIGNAKE